MMRTRLSVLIIAALLALAGRAAPSSAPELPEHHPLPEPADSVAETAPPALPPVRVLDPDTYIPSCLLTDEHAARRLAFAT
ncbi:MAG: hypothetical protein K2F97_02985, partial [Muribaculaceae bacterium]|nr:hypothetical protein [Muribaculaceae bacterium]